MSDQYEHDENEEYHFDDNESLDFQEEPEEFSFDETESTPVKNNFASSDESKFQQHKSTIIKVLMTAGIVLVIYLGLRFMGFFSSNTTQSPQPPTTPTQSVSSMQTQTPSVTKTSVPIPNQNNNAHEQALQNKLDNSDLTVQGLNNTHNTLSTSSNDADAKEIADLEAQQKNLMETINTLSQQNTQAFDRMENLEKSIASMENQVMQLNNALQTVVTAVKRAPAPVTQRPIVTSLTSSYTPKATVPMTKSVTPAAATYTSASSNSSRSSYYVQAIIPGRAWLRDTENKMMTVAPGDVVPGYGAVTAIDPQQGTVSLSNGTVLEYGIPEE